MSRAMAAEELVVGGTTKDELARVRAELQQLARLHYKQKGFTDEQAAQYKALVAQRDELALAIEPCD